jgi:hypothetical protein
MIFRSFSRKRYALCVSIILSFGVTGSWADTISFTSLLSGKSTFGFDADGDGASDVIFSTRDPLGFNTVGPGNNQKFIREPGLEGSSSLSQDLRVDFLTGARDQLSFGYALNSLKEISAYRAQMSVFDSFGNQLGSTSSVGRYTSTPLGMSSFPEGRLALSFSGSASYALFDFESEFGRYIMDNFSGDFTGITAPGVVPTTSQLQASVISSAFNFVRTSEAVENKRNVISSILKECTNNNGKRIDGTGCDYDALRRGEVDANIDLVKSANEAAFSSKDLVTRTSILPGNSVLEWIADIPLLIDEAIGFFKVIGSLFGGESNPDVVSSSVNGSIGEFSINPDFRRYDLDFVLDFESKSIFDGLIGQKFLFDQSFGGDQFEIGIGLVKSIGSNEFGGDRVTLNFVQLSTNDIIPPSLSANTVSAPSTLLLILIGFSGLLLVNRRTEQRKSPRSIAN